MSTFATAVAAVAVAATVLPTSSSRPTTDWSQSIPLVAAAPPIGRDDFRAVMRRLWEDHIVWTRLYIVSAAAGLPDLQPTAERLLKNQVDIGNAIKPFFGDSAGEHLTALLKQHILIAADLVSAAKASNNEKIRTASARWDSNAVAIADFLSGANSTNWPRETMRAEMRHHLELTLREAQARLESDWTTDIAAYDEIHDHILGLADVLATGIIKQFPKRFKT